MKTVFMVRLSERSSFRYYFYPRVFRLQMTCSDYMKGLAEHFKTSEGFTETERTQATPTSAVQVIKFKRESDGEWRVLSLCSMEYDED